MSDRIVRCPKCGKFRHTNASGYVKCFFCGKSFGVDKHVVSSSSYAKSISKEVKFE
ncbi:MAG: hypothetical protein M1348_01760 [Candidatus Parvarchaeota archaeon]|nr:hypothetical protein [Candidatus Parvarchaeota archaeon]MCL5101318.1 hypothetical protein [Candidatus Parvarchaeota archaeon]